MLRLSFSSKDLHNTSLNMFLTYWESEKKTRHSLKKEGPIVEGRD